MGHKMVTTPGRFEEPVLDPIAFGPAMKIVAEQIDANFRATAYAIGNCFVNQQRAWMEILRMDPTTMLVYMIVALAAVQKVARQSEIPESMRGSEPLPQHLVGTISRRAVASASGIPRETVRRIIENLLKEGRLITAGRNAVRVARDNARREGFVHVPAMLLPDILRMFEELRRLGVVVESPGAMSPGGDAIAGYQTAAQASQ